MAKESLFEYEKALDQAYEELPEVQETKQRLEIPKVKGLIQGNKTIISNFFNIANTVRRKPEHMFKYILKELATSGEIKGKYVIFNRKVSASSINEKIEKYIDEFVICKECGKPDTQLIKEGKYVFLKCLACGAKYSVNYLV